MATICNYDACGLNMNHLKALKPCHENEHKSALQFQESLLWCLAAPPSSAFLPRAPRHEATGWLDRKHWLLHCTESPRLFISSLSLLASLDTCCTRCSSGSSTVPTLHNLMTHTASYRFHCLTSKWSKSTCIRGGYERIHPANTLNDSMCRLQAKGINTHLTARLSKKLHSSLPLTTLLTCTCCCRKGHHVGKQCQHPKRVLTNLETQCDHAGRVKCRHMLSLRFDTCSIFLC